MDDNAKALVPVRDSIYKEGLSMIKDVSENNDPSLALLHA